MLSVKNTSSCEKCWGGLVFAVDETRVILTGDRTALANDSDFYMCILEGYALVYSDGVQITDPIVACEIIRMESRKDSEGVVYTRRKYAPDNYYHSSRTIRFTTNDTASLDQEWWPGAASSECAISLHTTENGDIVSATLETATLTKILWNPVSKMIPRYITINAGTPSVKSWVGFEGLDDTEVGRIYCHSHLLDNKVVIDVSEPRVNPASLVFYIGHDILQATEIEITVEYYTNYEND